MTVSLPSNPQRIAAPCGPLIGCVPQERVEVLNAFELGEEAQPHLCTGDLRSISMSVVSGISLGVNADLTERRLQSLGELARLVASRVQQNPTCKCGFSFRLLKIGPQI